MHNPYLPLMHQQVQLERKTAVDADGQSVFAAPVPVTCRVVRAPTRLTLATGDEVIASEMVWCAPGTNLQVEDRVTLPDNRVALLKRVDVAPDPRGRVWMEKGYCV